MEDSEEDSAGAREVIDLTRERIERARKWIHFRNDDLANIDEATARQLLAEHGRLVLHLARKYRLPERTLAPFDVDDMIATGRLVLLQAWVCFDPDRGMKFSSWAAFCIRRAFTCMLREAIAGSSRADLAEAPVGLVSLDEPAGDRSDAPTHDKLGEEDPAYDERAGWLREQLQHLSPREQRALELHLLDQSNVEIAQHLGVTRQRVEQLIRRAQEKLRWRAWDAGLVDDEEPVAGAPSDTSAPRRARRRPKLRLVVLRAAEA